MLEWYIASAVVVGTIGIANGILNHLRQKASNERQRWQNEYQKVQRDVTDFDQRIQQKIREAQYAVNFEQLTQLHFESMKVADHAYRLLSDARKSLEAIGGAIKDAGEEKNRLFAEKKNTNNYQRRVQLEQEISALIELRNQLFPDKDQLKIERDKFQEQVTQFNAKTHALKIAIRDKCGERGQDWYRRLEERTTRRQLGLPTTTAETRVRGKVKWYDKGKGFGFITPDSGGQDIHVSRNNLNNISSLSEGDKVEFTVKFKEKGKIAMNVSKVSRGWFW